MGDAGCQTRERCNEGSRGGGEQGEYTNNSNSIPRGGSERVLVVAQLADLEVQLDDAQDEVHALQTEIKQHETEKAIKDADGGTLVECTFAEPGSLGVVFEGTSGADIHVAGITSGSPASHLAHLFV